MKLLVVEDDHKIATAVKRGLEGEGFVVDVASDGDDGWWMATEAGYDMIILDVMLPGRDGYTLCSDLRAAGDWTPVLMLTAKDGDTAETRGLDVGADDYLTKPFSFPVLISRTRSILRRCARRDSAPIEIGGIRIDTVGRRVWVGDREVRLTSREFDILEYLTRRAGTAVSKDAILRGVWEFDFDGDPNIVQVYVARLRKKLGEAGADDLLHTVHGLGYRIDRHDN